MNVRDYFTTMEERGRLARVLEEGNPIAVCTFFLCNRQEEIYQFYQRAMWSTPEDSDLGEICYIDKLISVTWNKEIRNFLEKEIVSQHPQLKYSAWFRPTDGDDRLVLKEIKHVTKV